MSYIGAEPTTAAFPFDQFSGDGTTTAFTLTYAPASATSIVVAISGVMQNPNLYSVIGTTLTFSPAPPTGTNNISVLYLGLPVIGSSSPGNTAFLSATDLTATASQTVFASAGSYTPGFVQVYRNGARLGNADFTATNGTTITLASAATAGDLVTIEYYTLTSLTNALPLTGGTVTGSTTFNSTVTVNGAAVSGFTGMKNRIINGNMVVDQRNAGASVTPADSGYTLDRWQARLSQASKFTVQQNAGAVTSPTGFTNYLGVTSSSAYSLLSGDFFGIGQQIEGFNTADLGWGTASAQTISISFWVRSSLTGTFSCALTNDFTRGYVDTFTVSTANTWEYKTITIAGDTSGTWATNNTSGVRLIFNLGAGSSQNATPDVWGSWVGWGVSGAQNVVSTNGATFYITGVQLERGSNATSFEFIDYGRQLIQCQRYYEKTHDTGTAPGTNTVVGFWTMAGSTNQSNNILFPIRWKVEKRAAPTVTGYANDGTSGLFNYGRNGASGTTTATFDSIGTSGCRGIANAGAAWVVAYVEAQYAASAEL